jgi:redox-sensitive bicupin YhaK (pirin superfamily)
MTAATGILHEEFHSEAFSRSGGVLEMVQLWVNLPAKDKMTPPKYQAILNRDIPAVALPKAAKKSPKPSRTSTAVGSGTSPIRPRLPGQFHAAVSLAFASFYPTPLRPPTVDGPA